MTKKRNGFTLVEVTISILAAAVIMYAAIAIFITSGAKGMNAEVFTVAQSLAEGKMEEVMAKSFGGVSAESAANFSGDLSNYSYEVLANYVSGEALDSVSGSATNYKKIQVRIYNPLLNSPAILESVRANY